MEDRLKDKTEQELRKARLRVIFAHNLQKYMDKFHLDQSDIMKITNTAQSTVSGWMTAKAFPGMDKVEILADYFGISKSYLIDEPKIMDVEPKIYADIINGNVELKQVKRIEISDELGNKILDFFKRNPDMLGMVATNKTYTKEESEKIMQIVKLIID